MIAAADIQDQELPIGAERASVYHPSVGRRSHLGAGADGVGQALFGAAERVRRLFSSWKVLGPNLSCMCRRKIIALQPNRIGTTSLKLIQIVTARPHPWLAVRELTILSIKRRTGSRGRQQPQPTG